MERKITYASHRILILACLTILYRPFIHIFVKVENRFVFWISKFLNNKRYMWIGENTILKSMQGCNKHLEIAQESKHQEDECIQMIALALFHPFEKNSSKSNLFRICTRNYFSFKGQEVFRNYFSLSADKNYQQSIIICQQMYHMFSMLMLVMIHYLAIFMIFI